MIIHNTQTFLLVSKIMNSHLDITILSTYIFVLQNDVSNLKNVATVV